MEKNMKNNHFGDVGSKFVALLKWALYFVAVFVLFFIRPLFSKFIQRKSFNELAPDINLFALTALKVFGVKSELLNPHGVDLSKGYIIAGNHRSFFDQISLLGLFPKTIHVLAKSNYFDLPFFGMAMKTIECIPVENRRLGDEAKKILKKSVDNDEAVCFFVEGTRGEGRTLLPFKSGAFKTAAEYKKEILPIYILGTEQCLSKHKSRLEVKAGDVSIVIGKPEVFTLDNLDAEIADFEKRYTRTHNSLYDQFDNYLVMSKKEKVTSKFTVLKSLL